MGLRQVSRRNPNIATEIWSLRSKIQHPKPGVKSLATSRGSTGDLFMPSKSHVPNFSPLGFMSLAHGWMILTFIASICWNLVSTPLPLEVQSWGRWWSPFILLTSADMTTLGHCSCQAEGGIKLMEQLLVHSQRLGSLGLVWVPCCSFWLGVNKDFLPTFKPLAGGPFWAGTLLHFSTLSWATWPFLCLGLFPTSWDSWAYKMGIKDMLCHRFFTPHGL